MQVYFVCVGFFALYNRVHNSRHREKRASVSVPLELLYGGYVTRRSCINKKNSHSLYLSLCHLHKRTFCRWQKDKLLCVSESDIFCGLIILVLYVLQTSEPQLWDLFVGTHSPLPSHNIAFYTRATPQKIVVFTPHVRLCRIHSTHKTERSSWKEEDIAGALRFSLV